MTTLPALRIGNRILNSLLASAERAKWVSRVRVLACTAKQQQSACSMTWLIFLIKLTSHPTIEFCQLLLRIVGEPTSLTSSLFDLPDKTKPTSVVRFIQENIHRTRSHRSTE